ncbi:BPSL0067 family protein [Massilia sp. ST3]|uniref:BPSL0067 family protein n=1 Tax=Massilia sp. ST3 TaxID=2824903 RepID=UPI0035A278C0
MLRDKPKVGSTECVALVQHFTKVGPTSGWVAGERVAGNNRIAIGTAIATFRNGRYGGADHNNHTAFFLRHGPNGSIVVMDQWRDRAHRPRRDISIRTIERKGEPHPDGTCRKKAIMPMRSLSSNVIWRLWSSRRA